GASPRKAQPKRVPRTGVGADRSGGVHEEICRCHIITLLSLIIIHISFCVFIYSPPPNASSGTNRLSMFRLTSWRPALAQPNSICTRTALSLNLTYKDRSLL